MGFPLHGSQHQTTPEWQKDTDAREETLLDEGRDWIPKPRLHDTEKLPADKGLANHRGTRVLMACSCGIWCICGPMRPLGSGCAMTKLKDGWTGWTGDGRTSCMAPSLGCILIGRRLNIGTLAWRASCPIGSAPNLAQIAQGPLGPFRDGRQLTARHGQLRAHDRSCGWPGRRRGEKCEKFGAGRCQVQLGSTFVFSPSERATDAVETQHDDWRQGRTLPRARELQPYQADFLFLSRAPRCVLGTSFASLLLQK